MRASPGPAPFAHAPNAAHPSRERAAPIAPRKSAPAQPAASTRREALRRSGASAQRPECHAACEGCGELATGRKPRATRADLPPLDITNIMSTRGGQCGGARAWRTVRHGACSAGLISWRQAPRRTTARVAPGARSLPSRSFRLRTARQLRSRARSWSRVVLCASASLAPSPLVRCHAGCLSPLRGGSQRASASPGARRGS